MLTVGEDSYVTTEQATEYITGHYPSTDARAAAWAEMQEADQEIYLRRACESLSRLNYRGMTFEALQKLPFPRYFYPDGVMAYRELIAPLSYIYPELAGVPDDIRAAQIEEAFEMACPSADTEKYETINGAVSSYSIGHLSETFNTAGSATIQAVLRSGAAQKLVEQYVGGSYDIL